MGHIFRDTANTKIRNGQVCSRPGCGSRVNSPKGSQTGSSEKSKSLRPSTRSFSSGKEANGSSSRTFSGTSNPGKRILRPRKTLCSQSEAGSSETSIAHDEPKSSNLVPPPENIQRQLQAEVENVDSGDVTPMEVGSSSVTSSTRSRRNFHPKPGLRGQEVKSTGPSTHTGTNRYGLRNLRCNSILNVIPAGGCSSSDSTLNRRKDMIKKRNCEGESSSSARGKNISGPSFESRNAGARTGISFSDPRRSRNTPHRDRPDINVASVRTRRTVTGQARGRFSSQGNANPVAPDVSHSIIPPSSRPGDRNAPGVSHHSSAEAGLSCPSSYIIPGTSSDELYGVLPVSPSEHGITRSPIIREGFRRRYNMDGIAELLLALERIEQDVELTHEQIRMLESNLFPIGLNLHDQHRDMRLDIDNMSYEELLALEERMGTVSTALTEEALSECLKRSSYQPSDDAAGSCNEHKEDTKCSICQDEYLVADEVGSLNCEHKYHVVCIQQWLRLKNWCPICKALVGPSNLSTSSH